MSSLRAIKSKKARPKNKSPRGNAPDEGLQSMSGDTSGSSPPLLSSPPSPSSSPPSASPASSSSVSPASPPPPPETPTSSSSSSSSSSSPCAETDSSSSPATCSLPPPTAPTFATSAIEQMIALGRVSRQSSHRSLRNGALLTWLAADVVRMVFDQQHAAQRPPERIDLSVSSLTAFLLSPSPPTTPSSPTPTDTTNGTSPPSSPSPSSSSSSSSQPSLAAVETAPSTTMEEQLQLLINEHNNLLDQLSQYEQHESTSSSSSSPSSAHPNQELSTQSTQLIERAQQLLQRSSPLTWNLLIALSNSTSLDTHRRLSMAEDAVSVAVALAGVESRAYTASVLQFGRLSLAVTHPNAFTLARSASTGDMGLLDRSSLTNVSSQDSTDAKAIHWDGRNSRSSSKDDTDDPSPTSSTSSSTPSNSTSAPPPPPSSSSSPPATVATSESSIRAVPLLLRQACLNQAEHFADLDVDYALQCAHAASRLSRACIGDESEECALDLIRNSSLLRRNKRYSDALLHCKAIEPVIDLRNPCCSELYAEMSQLHWQLKQIEQAHKTKRKQVRVLLKQRNATRLPAELENAGVYFERSSVAASPYKLQDLAEAVRFFLAAALVTAVEGQRSRLLKKVTGLIFANRPMREADITEYLNKTLQHRSLEFFTSRRLSQAQMIRLVYVPPIAEQAYDECQVYPAFQGFLTKKGHVVHNWKHRWFVLYRRELTYYRSQKDSDRRGSIDVATISAVQEFPSNNAKEHLQHAFTIQTPGKPFVCCAPSAADRKQWIDVLLRAMQFWQDWMQEDEVFATQKDGGWLF